MCMCMYIYIYVERERYPYSHKNIAPVAGHLEDQSSHEGTPLLGAMLACVRVEIHMCDLRCQPNWHFLEYSFLYSYYVFPQQLKALGSQPR